MAVDPDLTVVNRYELEALTRRDGLVAVTLGEEGAVLLEDGEEVARATPPPVTRRRRHGRRRRVHARACSSRCSRAARARRRCARACAAGAVAASRFGAQPSLPTAAELDAVLDR